MQDVAGVLKAAGDSARQVDADAAFPRAAVAALRGSGLLGLTLPADVGGMGRGPEEFADVLTQLAAACGSTAMVYLMHVSAAMAVAAAHRRAGPTCCAAWRTGAPWPHSPCRGLAPG